MQEMGNEDGRMHPIDVEYYTAAPEHMMAIYRSLHRSRNALAGRFADAVEVLPRHDGARPVAFLATIGREGGDLVVPLGEGENVVGRGGSPGPFGTWPKPYAVEQSQWSIECRASQSESSAASARVSDAASTNQSYLVPRRLVPKVSISRGRVGFDGLGGVTGAISIPHPNVAAKRHIFDIEDGDVLCSIYAAFVFSWM